ncbi:MAG: hypothetical protein KF729_03390 [Sandaracinaceae bacterium]|nr:hypothetical protein [Sandaracinaceae bacterium]
MPRTLALTLLPVFCLAPSFALAQPGALATFDPSLAATVAEAPEAEQDDEYAEDETYDEEMEYCGGGESVLDEARYEMESGDEAGAHRRLVAALREGRVEEWERGYALALLGELQLRRGEPGRALVNFTRAQRIEPSATSSWRASIATALYLRGRRTDARETAREAREDACADVYAVASCYAANLVLSRTERDAETRAAAAEALATLRAAHPGSEDAFADVERRVRGS